MRFSASADTSAISLAAGEFAVVDGFVDLPEDIGDGDLAGLAANGFKRAADADEAAAKKPAKAKA